MVRVRHALKEFVIGVTQGSIPSPDEHGSTYKNIKKVNFWQLCIEITKAMARLKTTVIFTDVPGSTKKLECTRLF